MTQLINLYLAQRSNLGPSLAQGLACKYGPTTKNWIWFWSCCLSGDSWL